MKNVALASLLDVFVFNGYCICRNPLRIGGAKTGGRSNSKSINEVVIRWIEETTANKPLLLIGYTASETAFLLKSRMLLMRRKQLLRCEIGMGLTSSNSICLPTK